MGYKGVIVELPIGKDGFTGTKNLSETLPTQLIQAMNVEYSDGPMRKEGGSVKYNRSAISGTPMTLGGWDWWPAANTQRQIVYTDDGELLKDTGGGDYTVTLKTGLDTSALPMFVEGGKEVAANNRKLFVFNGVDPVQVESADGATTTDIGATGIDTPGAPTVALAGLGAGNLDTGVVYTYKITFVNGNGETDGGTVSADITPTGGDGQVALTAIPVSSHASVTARVIHRTEGGGSTYKQLTTLSDNTTTVYTDNTADGSLGSTIPGTNTATTQPIDWSSTNQPSVGAIHEGRLWGAGNANDAHRIYYSDDENHEDFLDTGSGQMPIYAGEGQKVVKIVSFKGFLIVWKYPRGIYAVDTTSVTVADWKVKRLNTGTSGINSMSAIIGDDDIIFIDANGQFQFLSTVHDFGDVTNKNLSKIADLNKWMRDNINFSRLDKCQAVWYPKKREARFAMSKAGSTINDIQIIIDFNRADLPRFRFSDQNTCESLWLRLEADNTFRPLCGDDAGFVWKLDDDTRSKDGEAFEGLLQTPHDDFGWKEPLLVSKRKNGQFLELVVEPKGNWDTNVDVYWDDEFEDTYKFNMGITGATLGSFKLGVDALAGDSVLNTKRRITGSGKRFSLIASNAGIGEDFSISKFLLYFTVGDEKN